MSEPLPGEMRAVLAADPGDRTATPGGLSQVPTADLPEGDLTVRVICSSLNYKDGLAVTGKGRVVRSFPMVCGVDLVGEVVASGAPGFGVGDMVVVTGFGVGEEHWGGFAEYARVRSEWAVRLPDGMTPQRAMAIGTAGLTAMLCVLALERHGLSPGGGSGDLPVLVTGAAGGVGSVAVALLANLGYTVAAASGRPEQADYLRSLGATEIVPRSELAVEGGKPLERETYAGVVDAVGGTTLATAIRRTRYGGTVAACGLAGGADLPTTVHPFILRAVTLVGVESVRCPLPARVEAWRRLAEDLPVELLDGMTTVEPLEAVPQLADAILAGQTRGRVVIGIAG
ncbi:MAG TPA: MDR family oxidoreductase [Acidimicrobiales bacterium]|nr:MDR family oxidoreductase [Acidimicrobiales bacterium]